MLMLVDTFQPLFFGVGLLHISGWEEVERGSRAVRAVGRGAGALWPRDSTKKPALKILR